MFKNILVLFFLIIVTCLTVSGQTTPLEKATNLIAIKTIELLNKKQPDSVYTMTGVIVHKTISPALWNSLFKDKVLPLLPFRDLTFESSTDSTSKYKLQGSIPLVLYISLDKTGKINNFNFQPSYKELPVSEIMPEARKTDSVARTTVRLINEKKADSAYLLAGDAFRKQIDANAWKNILEKSIYPLTPFTELLYISSNQKINRYKSGQFQFLIGLDQQDKLETFLVEPYREVVADKKFNSDNPLKSRLDSAVNLPLSAYMRNKGNVGLSVGVYYQGKDHYYNYGETKAGNMQLPTNHNLYDIGSITKTFTATLLALAVNEGKVNLSSPISRFLPDSVAGNPALKGITLMQLSNHTSGLPRIPSNMQQSVIESNQPYANYDTRDLFSFLKNFKSIRQPGIKYEYSNLAVGLLGVILERVYHKPYSDLITKYITKPAKLHQTQIVVKTADTALVAQGYNEMNLAIAPWTFKCMTAAGAIKSSTFDMLNYGKLQLSDDASSPLIKAIKLTHEVTYKKDETIGLGWHFIDANPKIVQHSGATGGYRALVCADLEHNMVVVVLTNNSSSGDALGFEIVKALGQLK
jgi:CubicO group peptidase (beta-lactamase class C family)